MKQILITGLFLIGGLMGATATYAQDVVEESVETVDSPVESLEIEREENGDEITSTIRIELEEEADIVIDQELVDEVIAEFDEEMSNWTDEDRQQLVEALEGLGEIDISTDVGFGESLVAIVAITLSLGMPIIIVAIVAYSTYRKKRLMHETINNYVNSDRDIPPEVMSTLTAGAEPKNALQSGLVLVGVGLGLMAFFFMVGAKEAMGIGFIPLFIGLAKLLVWKLDSKKGKTAEVAID